MSKPKKARFISHIQHKPPKTTTTWRQLTTFCTRPAQQSPPASCSLLSLPLRSTLAPLLDSVLRTSITTQGRRHFASIIFPVTENTASDRHREQLLTPKSRIMKYIFIYQHKNGSFCFQNQITVEAENQDHAIKKAEAELSACYGASRLKFFSLKIGDTWRKVSTSKNWITMYKDK